MSLHKNLTLDTRLIVPAPALDAAPLHHLVVFEEGNQGRTFFECLPPGDTFRLKWFQNKANYSAFRVDAAPEIWHRCSRFLQTLDHRHDYKLDLTLKVTVDDPRLLVEAQSRDPLRIAEERVVELLKTQAQALTWESIWNADIAFQESVQVAVGEINLTTRRFGLRLLDVLVERKLPDEAVAPDASETIRGRRIWDTNEAAKILRKQSRVHAAEFDRLDSIHQAEASAREMEQLRQGEVEAQKHEAKLASLKADQEALAIFKTQAADQQQELDRMRHALERQTVELKLLPGQRALQNEKLEMQMEGHARQGVIKAIGVISEMMNQAKESVQSFPEMGRALQDLQGVRDEMRQLVAPMVVPRGVLGERNSGSPHAHLESPTEIVPSVASYEGRCGPWSILHELELALSNSSIAVQAVIVPAVLRFLAAAVEHIAVFSDRRPAERSGDDLALMEARRALDDALAEVSEHLDEEQVALLRRVGDPAGLHERLWGVEHG